jgi:hypothetical protein
METLPEPEHKRVRRFGLAVVAVVTFTVVGRLLGYGFGTHTIVRCRRGHLFTTVWIPGVNLKALDLGVARIQRCPAGGGHWSLVTPVRAAELSPLQRARARARRDIRLP